MSPGTEDNAARDVFLERRCRLSLNAATCFQETRTGLLSGMVNSSQAEENDHIFNLSFVSKIWLMLAVAPSTAFSVPSAAPATPGIVCPSGISLWRRLPVLVCRERSEERRVGKECMSGCALGD